MAVKKQEKKFVVVRTYSAGVHFGVLVSQSDDGKVVVLREARRMWRWSGAYTLHEVASKGIGPESKVSCLVPEIKLSEAIEVITCTSEGRASLEAAKWAP